MILSDDQSWTDYGFMGHDVIRTPHLDRLASESVVYPRAYVTTPLCRPSLMTLATGHYAKDHKITGNDPSTRLADRKSEKFKELSHELLVNIDRLDTLPKILSRNGYLTHQSGKWWEGSYQRGGFTHGMTEGDTGGMARHGDKGLDIGRKGMEPIFSFIETAENEEKPFYLWYAPFLPHTPHNPPARILEHYQGLGLDPALAKYYAMCEWFDETCGELIEHLEKKGLRENTLIYYVCDNGWIQRTADTEVSEGWFTSFAPKSKQSVYDGGARSPIMLSWPAELEADIKGDLVSSIDIVPTVLSAAGLDIPEGLPGIDLLPNAKEGETIDRDIIFGDSYAHDIADLDNPEASLMYLWCIRDRWKLILTYDGEVNRYDVIHPRNEPIQLFDIVGDPHETVNLADRYPNIVQDLKDQIENWYPLTERKLVLEK
ncbi:sulfatase-like hydrolase/transferase [Pelagicoccus mobilis]